MKTGPMKLYWVTTADHDEDWFIVATSRRQAAQFHEREEGYERGDAEAEEILAIPPQVAAEVGWPSEAVLLALGARYLHFDEPRVVEIGGRRFCEGMLEATIQELNDDQFEAQGQGRPNKTKKTPLQ